MRSSTGTTRVHGVGTLMYINDSVGLHKVGNPTGGRSVSLHIYAPGWKQCPVFEEVLPEVDAGGAERGAPRRLRQHVRRHGLLVHAEANDVHASGRQQHDGPEERVQELELHAHEAELATAKRRLVAAQTLNRAGKAFAEQNHKSHKKP